jgi:hypothetical protein
MDNLAANPDFECDKVLNYFQYKKWKPEEKAHGEFWGIILEHAPVDDTLGSKTPLITPEMISPLSTKDELKTKGINLLVNHALIHLGPKGARDLTAIEMTWAAAQEALTSSGYGRINRRTTHPVLKQNLPIIRAQENVHFTIYNRQAFLRLSSGQPPVQYLQETDAWRDKQGTPPNSLRAQRLTRYALTHVLSPVGTAENSSEAFGMVATILSLPPVDGCLLEKEDAHIADSVDAKIARLPGLADIRPMRGAVDKTLTEYRKAVGL